MRHREESDACEYPSSAGQRRHSVDRAEQCLGKTVGTSARVVTTTDLIALGGRKDHANRVETSTKRL